MYEYKKKTPVFTTAEKAILKIKKGKRIVVGSGCAAPQYLIKELVHNYHHFYDNEIAHILTVGKAPYSDKKYCKSFRHNGFFVGSNVRQDVNEGHADYIPIFLHDVPYLFKSKQLPIHCVLVNISRPNRHGYVSLGTSIDILPEAISRADIVIAQMNDCVPFTFGPCLIPLHAFDYIVERTEPLQELDEKESDADCKIIGKYIAEHIPDGATLQLGIGGIPDSILSNLHDKNDLGIHTEMFSDGIVELFENGNINNMRKNINFGKSVTSFVLGTEKIFNFVDHNYDIEFWPTEYTNDPFNIAKNDEVISVNSAIQIDLTGQVCSDSIGERIYSGFGGQVDFVRGAQRSKNGKSFIVLKSTVNDGKASRIVTELDNNAGVVTSRADVQYVATEYGIAYLHGRNLRERGLALAEIAHPDYRQELLNSLKNKKIVYLDQEIPLNDDREIRYCIPKKYTFNDLEVYFRPLKSDDIRILQDFFYSHSESTIKFRYHHLVQSLPLNEAKERVAIDYTKDMAIGGFLGNKPSSKLVSIARYYDIGKKVAEIGLVVHEDLQNFGIGTFMLKELISAAKKQEKNRLVGHVLKENVAMISVFKKFNFSYETSSECNGHEFSLTIPTLE